MRIIDSKYEYLLTIPKFMSLFLSDQGIESSNEL